MEEILQKVLDWLTSFGLTLLIALAVLVGGLLLVRLLVGMLKKSRGMNRIEGSARQFLLSFIKIALNIIVVFSAAIIIGFPAASIVTMLASAGVAIGLALQGALSNFAGGMMLVIFKPFRIGDYITAEGYSGTVTNISVFYTTIKTDENKSVTLPNGGLTNAAIVNSSVNGTLRVDLTFAVGYNSNAETVRCVLLSAAAALPQVLETPSPKVVLAATADSALEFSLRAWCRSEDYWDVLYALREKGKLLLDENGIEIPFPQLDVHLDK